jgi:uncharacterized membrane protein YjjP (DUF1212 family)
MAGRVAGFSIMASIHEYGEVDWFDGIVGTAFTFFAIMAFQLPSRLGFDFTAPLGLGLQGVNLTVATVGSIVAIVAAFLTNSIDSSGWSYGEWGIMGAMVLIIVGFIAIPAVRDLIMGNIFVAFAALAVEGVGFALIAYY